MSKKKIIKKAKKSPMLYFVLGALVILVTVTVIVTREGVKVTFDDDYMTVSAKDRESVIYYDDITHYSFSNLDDKGILIEGDDDRLLIGTFENAEFGEYIRYSFASAPDRVVVKTSDKTVVFNMKSEKETRELYLKLADILKEKK